MRAKSHSDNFSFMRPEDYLRMQYHDYEVLFVHEVRQEYIDLIMKNPGKKFIVTSELFYKYMIQRMDLQAKIKLYDPSYFIVINLSHVILD